MGITAGPQRHLQPRVAVNQVPQGADARVRLGGAGIEQRVQRPRPAVLQDLLKQRHRQLLQAGVARRATHRQEAAAVQVEAGEQLLATHVLIAGGDIALANGKLLGPAGDGVLVEADPRIGVAEPVPRTGAAAKGIDLVPGQVPPPTADGMTRRTATAAAQSGEAGILHLVQVKDALQADDQREDAGQQPLTQGTVSVGEAVLGGGQPVQGGRHQQEGTRVLGFRGEKGGGGSGTGGEAATTI